MGYGRDSTIRLPGSPDRAALLPSLTIASARATGRICLPQLAALLLFAASCFLSGIYVDRASSAVDSGAPSSAGLSLNPLRSAAARLGAVSSSRGAPPSCRLCDADPSNPLCEYGDAAIRMSRAFEGSGVRVRRFLAKALRGDEVKIGVIGASVTAGHGLDHGGHVAGPAYPQRWLAEFQKTFPRARMFDGSAPAMDSAFYSYCYKAMVPEPDIDLWLVELDINNDNSIDTMQADDILMRSLLSQPNEPAVIRLSVLALLFEDMARGAVSNLLLSQFFDVPVISIKNFLLPHLIANPDVVPDYFTKFYDGKPDTRHVNINGHVALADMLSLYMHEQTCITKQEQARGRLGAKEGTPWPADELWGTVPRLRAWEKYSASDRVDHVEPTCRFASSKSHPLIPAPSSDLGAVPVGSTSSSFEPESLADGWQRIEWNDKAALASREVGAVVKFEVEGSTVGVAVWEWAGPPHGLAHEMPGRASCWIDDDERGSTVIDAYSSGVAGSRWSQIGSGLSTRKHTVSCQIIRASSTTGHEVRIMGVVSH
ncbi:hypothetical protein DMC30DRAFT_357328 [Rhodotorula diobovata]|uniref:Capsular associated protein n=1 Tax=Rhodotorula diobovata TaxID=5288 RepID=A0A5C5FKI6_9BASI|nr:hypothetical protein DMC30DRAFT_357328 [Rhodotorula diobovata]